MNEQDSEDIVIPEGSMYYQCSNCTYINKTYYGVQTHTKNKPECSAIGATVVQKLKAYAVTPEIEEQVDQTNYSPPAAAPQAQGVTQRPQPVVQSMAQQAGAAPSPQWVSALRDPEPEIDDELEENVVEYEQQNGYLPLNPDARDVRFSQMPVIPVPPDIQVFYAAFVGFGWLRTLADMVWDAFYGYMTIQGVSVTINDVPPHIRELALARSGLYDE